MRVSSRMFWFAVIRCLEGKERETEILNSLTAGYDKRLRPNYGGDPVTIAVTMHISDISAISEVDMDYTLDIYLRQFWRDERLVFSGVNESLTIGIDMVASIWVPDTFFPNEKSSFFHEASTHNSFLRINHQGFVTRSMRLTVTVACPMSLQFFPLDSQNCSFEIESYGYSDRDIRYTWKDLERSVTSEAGINLAQFSVGAIDIRERSIRLSTGAYSRLSAHFHFQRAIGFYLIQIYLPSSLIVVISWVSFWLNREATQARVTIGVMTVLTMTTLMTSTNSSMPKVSYVKSIDIYLGTCFIVVFASLLEYAAVGYLAKRLRMGRERHRQNHLLSVQAGLQIKAARSWLDNYWRSPVWSQAAGSAPDETPCDCDVELAGLSHASTNSNTKLIKNGFRPGKKRKPTTLALAKPGFREAGNGKPDKDVGRFRPSQIDKYSRIIFPLIFISFHIIYWTLYTNAAKVLAH